MVLSSIRASSRHTTVALLIASSIISCSSLTKQGEKLFEAGLYDQAERKFSTAVSKNPNDIEAIYGLAKSRETIIDKGLIEVRMLRLANNTDAALTKLELILSKQKDWQTKLNTAVTETQQVEVEFAIQTLTQQMQNAIHYQKPDLAMWLAYTKPNLAKSPRSQAFLREKQPEILELGRQRCTYLTSLVSGHTFFLKNFAESYCSYWEVPVSLPTAAKDPTRFRALTIDDLTFYDTGGMARKDQIANRLKEAFKSSPYYSQVGSGNLTLRMMGTLRYRHFRDPVSRSVNYTDRQEWTEVRYENSFKPDGSISQTPHSITRHQDVPKIHEYTAIRHDQTLTLDLKLVGQVLSDKLVLSFSRQETRQSLEHSEVVPEARLYPQSAELIDFNKWLEGNHTQVEKQFSEKLESFWTSSHCDAPLSAHSSTKAEQIHRCAKTNPHHHAVKTWFESNFGIDHDQTWTLLRGSASSMPPTNTKALASS